MSVFNGDLYLDDCIQSILNQTFKDFEFLIINDGSTDKTKNIIEKYRENDDRIRIINQKNIGLTQSLIKGVELCKSNYIARQDADDLSTEKRLEKQYNKFKIDKSLGIIGSNTLIIDKNSNILKKTSLRSCNFWLKKEIIFGNCFVHGSVMFRKDIYYKVGGYNKKYFCAQDFDLWIRMAEKCKIENTRSCYYILRCHENSISSVYRDKQNRNVISIIYERNKKYKNPFLRYFYPKCKNHIELRLLIKQRKISKINDLKRDKSKFLSVLCKLDYFILNLILKISRYV